MILITHRLQHQFVHLGTDIAAVLAETQQKFLELYSMLAPARACTNTVVEEAMHDGADNRFTPVSESTQRFVDELRSNINASLANIGVVSAFMCALAANIYVNQTPQQLCYGEAGLIAIAWIEWFSMGFFFLSISFTVLLAADLSGVPDRLLLRHLSQSQMMYFPNRALWHGPHPPRCGLWH